VVAGRPKPPQEQQRPLQELQYVQPVENAHACAALIDNYMEHAVFSA